MKKLVELLPQIFIYFALGFTYLKIFRYINTIKALNEHNHIVWEYLISGYIINLFMGLIPFGKIKFVGDNDILIYALMIIITFAFGLILGKIYSLSLWDRLLNKIKINRTRKSYVFDDMISETRATYLDLYNYKTNERYFGQIFVCEEYTNSPIVVLYHYKHWSDYTDDSTLENYKERDDKAVMIKIADFDSVEFQYEPSDDILIK